MALLTAAGCGTVGKGPDPEPVVDMSRPADLIAAPLCSAKSCNGCCQGDICQPGITTMACGSKGAVCSQCADAQMCGADFLCAFDPNARWLVVAVKATVSTTNPATPTMPWRMDGSMPQPYAQFDVLNRTDPKAIVVSGNPPDQVWTVTWAQGFVYTAKDLLSTGFDLQVFDKVSATMSTAMSSKHHVTLSQQDFVTKNLTYQGWEGVKTLSVVLQRQ